MGLLIAAALILSGLLLAVSALGSIPKMGDAFRKAARALAPWGVVIGVVDLALGALEVLGWLV